MKSFRASPELDEQLARAARIEGVPVSQFVRKAIEERCARVLAGTLSAEMADVIGSARAEPEPGAEAVVRAGRAAEVFTELLLADHQRRVQPKRLEADGAPAT